MRFTHYGHACVLVEVPGSGARVLIDPGTYSRDFESLRGLDLILITHAHPDHLDAGRVRALIADNPQATVVHSPAAAGALEGLTTTTARPGDKLTVKDVEITVTGSGEHACVHADIPGTDNNGYLIDGLVLHPGDAFDPPPGRVDVLLVPVGAPWLKIGEAVDYVRAVAPRVAVPIHQAGLAAVHQQMHYQLLRNLTAAEVVILDHGVSQAL